MNKPTNKDDLVLAIITFLNKNVDEYYHLEWDDKMYNCIFGYHPEDKEGWKDNWDNCIFEKQELLSDYKKPYIYMYVRTKAHEVFNQNDYWEYCYDDNTEGLEENTKLYESFINLVEKYDCHCELVNFTMSSGIVMIYKK